MMFAALLPATALTVFWLILMSLVEREDWIIAAYNDVFDNRVKIEKLRKKSKERTEILARYKGAASVVIRLLFVSNYDKKIKSLEKRNEMLQRGKLRKTKILPMPGYVLQRLFEVLGKGGIHKIIATKCSEMHGRKHAANKAKHVLAKLLSYPIIGIAAALLLSAVLLSAGYVPAGAAVAGVGSVFMAVLIYAMYDELSSSVKKRRMAISRQFPNVVSKLALLMTSGMIVDRAWRETAYSHDSELYLEMRKTSQELNNLVSPEIAYSGFINRCNTKETAKLASAIMQNLSKGNTEIGRLLKDMAREAWLDRRHTAKQDAEKANSKLMIPTMLLFISILLILLVPIAMNFSGF